MLGLRSVYTALLIGAGAVLCAPNAHAQGRDEQLVRQKVNKLWNQPQVQDLWKKTQHNLGVLHGKADELTEGALSAFQRQWLFQTNELMNKFYASDIPQKLQNGDWSVRDEVLYLITGKYQAEHKQDMLALEQEMLDAVKSGEITMEQFLALLKTLYEEPAADATTDGVTDVEPDTE